MTRTWVGLLITITFVLSLVGTAVSAPHEIRHSDNFERPDPARWQLVQGAMSFETGIGTAGDTLTWMVVADDNDSSGLGPSRVRVNATHMTQGAPTWNTTSGSYYYSATLENHQTYTAPASTYVAPTTAATGPASNSTGGGSPPAGGGATTTSGTLPASITPDATSIFSPGTVTFVLDSTHANASTLSWTFDKNNNGIIDASGTGLPATVPATYTGTGTRIAVVNVTDGNDTGEATVSILLTAAPPLAVTLSASGTTGTAPASVDFDLTSSDAASSGWTWSLDADGDSAPDASGTGLPQTIAHTYMSPGTYTATLTVSDGSNSGIATLLITIGAAPGDGFPEGAIGITFGEDLAGGGYYVAGFTNDRFFLGVPNATANGFDILVDLPDWGGVDPRKQNIDVRHKYAVEVDGTSVTVYVDNWLLGNYALPGIPRGLFGVIADDDMRVNVGEVRWKMLDKVAPTVDIFRPEAGTMYIEDEIAIRHGATDVIFVRGDLTMAVDIADNPGGIGLRFARAHIDGDPVAATTSPGIDTTMKVPTGSLSTGYHTLTVWGVDHSGNIGVDEVRIFVLGNTIPSVGTTTTLVNDLVGPL